MEFYCFFFILCCVCLPFCCRRVRRDRGGNATQQQNSTDTLVAGQRPIPTRKVDFTALLSKTTMQVKSTHLITKDDSLRITGDIEDMSTMDNDVAHDVELGESEESEKQSEDAKSGRQLEDVKPNSCRRSSHRSCSRQKSLQTENMVLQLPKDGVNGDRVVPSMCAICLSSYRIGESVSWSASPQCSHAYHTSCIVQYAETEDRRKMETLDNDADKKPDVSVPCPLCRNPYVHCSHDDV